ncbi:DNA primase [Methylobacterium hispanicum]|uniref:DNA primase n=1 Tax=Methylobacterium hispanicum TaxID=270350 RepID=A0AAV4ZRV2_9HYPH|nr:DNA primase [Methylobacterium hispanicum]GJD90927.1 DNA primase [Methylobacterium hispanicum]
MRFSPAILDEIRARIPVSQVAGRRVTLRRSGREWKGLSPFRQERTPSFFVNDGKRFYHCFSSGKHGDVFRFLMETEGMTFPEAVETLAAEAGVGLPERRAEGFVGRSRRTGILDALGVAAGFYRNALAGDEGGEGRSFLARRGIEGSTCDRFGIGYAPPGWDRLRAGLLELGYDDAILAEAGLVGTGARSLSAYDRFRDRILLPIHDPAGRLVGFGARALSDDGSPKYLNSPETRVFRKSELLFNFHRARSADPSQPLVVVEGYLDVIALDGSHWQRTVSPMGTALTREQLHLAWRLSDEPVLLFDGDDAGIRAADRAIDAVLPELLPGRSVRIGLLSDGDPDSLVRDGRLDEIAEAVDGALPLVEALWRRGADGVGGATPERRAGFESRLLASVDRIRDPIVRRHYADEFARRLGAPQSGRGSPERKPDPDEILALTLIEAHPTVARPLRDDIEAAGLVGAAASDVGGLPPEEGWLAGPDVDAELVRTLLIELLRVLRQRARLRIETALDAA